MCVCVCVCLSKGGGAGVGDKTGASVTGHRNQGTFAAAARRVPTQ